jgi:hypothetical protein
MRSVLRALRLNSSITACRSSSPSSQREGETVPAANAARRGERGTAGKYLAPAVMQRKLGAALKAYGLPAW